MTKQPVRIHAGNNGVYDAVERDGAWWIRFIPWRSFALPTIYGDVEDEFSVTSYESAHEVMLAYERGPIAYRTSEVVT